MSCCAGDAGWFAAGELAGLGLGEPFAGVAGEGITIPGVCPEWPGAVGALVVLVGTFAAGFLLTIRLAFRFGVALGLGFGFGLLMFGML